MMRSELLQSCHPNYFFSAETNSRFGHSVGDSIRAKRDTADFWINDFNSFKTNVQTEAIMLMNRISRNPGFSPTEQEENKRNKLTQFQNDKMRELEQKIEKLNKSLEKSTELSPYKVMMKGCWAGASAFAATNGLATAVAPNPITAIVGAISGVIAVVCTIVDANITR